MRDILRDFDLIARLQTAWQGLVRQIIGGSAALDRHLLPPRTAARQVTTPRNGPKAIGRFGGNYCLSHQISYGPASGRPLQFPTAPKHKVGCAQIRGPRNMYKSSILPGNL